MEMDKIKTGVLKCLSESLAISTEGLSVTSRLIADLGVDSLDILDISFSLEKEFEIKLRGSALDDLLKMDFETNPNGFLKKEDVDKFISWMPALAEDKQKELKPVELFNYITIESLVVLIHSQNPLGM